MSLEITDTNNQTDVIWYDKPKQSHIHALTVWYVCASGAELQCCLQITGMRQDGNEMRFYGDMAKHIVGNWNN